MVSKTSSEIQPGSSFPIGATVQAGGVNFSVYSREAEMVELLLFDRPDAPPARSIPLDAMEHRTYHYWHAFVPGAGPGQLYGFRVHGPSEPWNGFRYDPNKVLLDPYGRGVVVPEGYTRAATSRPGDDAVVAMKSVVTDPSAYDWEGDAPLKRPYSRTVIYEMHVAGFTRHPNSGVPPEKRGTYAGLIEKIPYLVDLGVTAVELLPVYQFDTQDSPSGLINYWGYAPVSFFAPHAAYASRKEPLGPVDEFRDMVKALHRAGIEVILDVVYNHTAEGNHEGPTFCFRGFENGAYYILEQDKRYYANYTGCGNTLNANHPIVRRMIVDSLKYWVREMHVDGFRFDLASILSREESGIPLANPPILWDIESDPVLAGIKLIAEAWDAAGLYQVGSFIGDSWKEWNGKFRDDVRSFMKGDEKTVSVFAARLLASPDLYADESQGPEQSVNFITCHDGFTLNDLVSYNGKHNEGNLEGNRDGADDNRSWNCGAEGPSDDSGVEQLRNRQVKNFLAPTLLAMGTPMILMGDEVRRTQRGNNNAYCQDNEMSWFDWTQPERHADIHRFVKALIHYRLSLDRPGEEDELTLAEILRQATIRWHGVRLGQPDWSDHSHTIACEATAAAGHPVYWAVNAYWEPLTFELPAPQEGWAWRRILDTSLNAPDDCRDLASAPVVGETSYALQPRSCVLLVATPRPM
jgi:isoamylase